MSLMAIAFSTQVAVPVAQIFTTYARPLLGLGVLIALLMIFKPMIRGLARAVLLAVKPRPTLDQRNFRSRLQGVLMLNRMANELDSSQPSLAAELRLLAARG